MRPLTRTRWFGRRDTRTTHKSCAFDEFRCATPHADEVLRKARHSREKHIDKSGMRPLTQTKWFGGHDTRARSKLTNHERNPSRGRGGSGIATLAREAERQMKHATPHANEVLRKARHSHEKQIYKSKMRPLTHMRWFGKHDTRTRGKPVNEISDRRTSEAPRKPRHLDEKGFD